MTRFVFTHRITAPELLKQIDSRNITLVEQFLADKEIRCSSESIKNYKSDLQQSGIYCIENTANGKRYIGQSINIEKRIYQHKYNWKKADFNETCGENRPLWYAIKKYGESSFNIYLLHACTKDELNYLETLYIQKFNTLASENGYNILKDGFSRRGTHHTEETKIKLSLSNTGKKRTQETKEKISISKLGVPRSKDAIEKMAASKRGRKQNPEHVEKHRQIMIGKKLRNCSSRYIGVSFDKARNKWSATTFLEKEDGLKRRKRKNIGRFETETLAAEKYNEFVIKHGLDRPLNVIRFYYDGRSL